MATGSAESAGGLLAEVEAAGGRGAFFALSHSDVVDELRAFVVEMFGGVDAVYVSDAALTDAAERVAAGGTVVHDMSGDTA